MMCLLEEKWHQTKLNVSNVPVVCEMRIKELSSSSVPPPTISFFGLQAASGLGASSASKPPQKIPCSGARPSSPSSKILQKCGAQHTALSLELQWPWWKNWCSLVQLNRIRAKGAAAPGRQADQDREGLGGGAIALTTALVPDGNWQQMVFDGFLYGNCDTRRVNYMFVCFVRTIHPLRCYLNLRFVIQLVARRSRVPLHCTRGRLASACQRPRKQTSRPSYPLDEDLIWLRVKIKPPGDRRF